MADILAAGSEEAVLLAAQEGHEVVVEPAAAVVTGVNYEGFTVTVFAKCLGVELTVAGGVHALDVHIANLAAGEFLHHFLPLAHPALVKERSVRCGGSDKEFLLLA